MIEILIVEIDEIFLIEQYEHGPVVLKQYVRHAKQHECFELFLKIDTFLSASSVWDDYEIDSIQTIIAPL